MVIPVQTQTMRLLSGHYPREVFLETTRCTMILHALSPEWRFSLQSRVAILAYFPLYKVGASYIVELAPIGSLCFGGTNSRRMRPEARARLAQGLSSQEMKRKKVCCWPRARLSLTALWADWRLFSLHRRLWCNNLATLARVSSPDLWTKTHLRGHRPTNSKMLLP